MLARQLSLLALAAAAPAAFAQTHTPGSFEDGGDTLVSAMMMFLGNDEVVYVLDKAEGNAAQINGHAAWGSAYNIAGRTSQTMDVVTNTFCASGMHLPNGSYATFGGNGAAGPGGNMGDVLAPGGYSATYDTTYQDYSGSKSIRILNPCKWDDLSGATEPLGDGSIALIGGFVEGGYINRNYPNVDPATEGGAAEPTYEFYPSKGDATLMNFMVKTSGLNSYAHTYLMPSGKMFVQANLSTMLWDPENNVETDLPPMPDGIVRVYPASGATAMMPLTPANDYTPSVLFCGGSDMPDYYWGNYSWPFYNTWTYGASAKCHYITPEPTDGSTPKYVETDDMPKGRTMGQFIHLPDGKMLVVNGGAMGTAGFSKQTLYATTLSQMTFGESLAADPVGQPAIYDPTASSGSYWSTEGLDTSNIARLYHSSAILLPDASVLIAGSNPNLDVNMSTVYPTTYKAELFYPPYFSASTRPTPQNVPSTLSYGGAYFDVLIPPSSYSGSANDAAANTTVWVIRTGWTTHAMNMGQRSMQLNNTYTVNSNGSISLHVSQLPPNANLFQPGPAMLFVTMSGIPSNGTFVLIGSGDFGTQPTSPAASLPPSVQADNVSGSAPSGSAGSSSTSSNSSSSSSGSTSHTAAIIGGIVGAVAVVGILGAAFGVYVARRRRAASQAKPASMYAMSSVGGAGALGRRDLRNSDSSAFVPLQHENKSMWDGNASNISLSPYHDEVRTGGPSAEFDPYYQNAPRR
ncbi:glyoxal oxidase N-terminus-domain-containing protein [Fomitopsis serialis]|uniref:glyoxal oxidase N-terminus-domain-containing protein n=1 Tax=Fomitopsis serialis TaxID=139415 RepID=UPI0020084F0B|nr:glyoxal oxidase N-terminus-domain-containing protein [Neoantrodia serialis]KAH9923857.1 glyoxal oxidase N-terminus-domain-containing protein [Neoantrodia serialis]